MGLKAAIGALVTERASELPAAGASLRERWAAIAPELATPSSSAAGVGADSVAGRSGARRQPGRGQRRSDRLARRLHEQMRLGSPIADPVDWLISRVLPRRQDGAEPRCADRQPDRRAQHRGGRGLVTEPGPAGQVPSWRGPRRHEVANRAHGLSATPGEDSVGSCWAGHAASVFIALLSAAVTHRWYFCFTAICRAT